MRCLRCLRDLKKWSKGGKIGKKWAKMGKNGCPRIPIYTLLAVFNAILIVVFNAILIVSINAGKTAFIFRRFKSKSLYCYIQRTSKRTCALLASASR